MKEIKLKEVIEQPKTANAAPISFTEGAIKELKRLLETLNISDKQGLRIGVKGGGCAGLSYLLAFDHLEDDDNTYEIEGIPVFIKKNNLMYLVGMEVDWEEGINNKGFTFSNPNASETCGCGESFSA